MITIINLKQKIIQNLMITIINLKQKIIQTKYLKQNDTRETVVWLDTCFKLNRTTCRATEPSTRSLPCW